MRTTHLSLASAALLCALAWPAANAVAASSTPGSRFLHGESTICLQQGKPLPGGWTVVYKLHASPIANDKNAPLIAINAVERGTQVTSVVDTYFNELAGTATVAMVNDALGNGEQIQLSLVGNSYGAPVPGDVANSGIYTMSYTLQLDKKSLNGSILGLRQFTPIADGVAGTTTPSTVDDTLTLLSSCPSDLQ